MDVAGADLGGLGAELVRRADLAGMLLVWRVQHRTARQVVVRDGRVEGTRTAAVTGQGLQVVGADGHGAFGSRDEVAAEPALELLERLLRVVRSGARLGLERTPPPDLPRVRGRRMAGDEAALRSVDLRAVGARLVELESELGAATPGLRWQLVWRAELDAWRILRNGGTDVAFAMPRCTLSARATAAGEAGHHSVSASVFAPFPHLLDDEGVVARWRARARAAGALARALPAAPPHPAGSFPLVIDYGLAKGLAHEAFGHASEADGFRSSILAEDGRFRAGLRVGAPHVSIVDEPVAGDHAWQPYSANGVVRERATIVDHGVLRDALSDVWTSGAAGGRISGAARAESFQDPPQPRMTNIRIEVDDPLPAPGEFEDYDATRVRDLLRGAGVLRRHPRVVFLSGYGGGQVNTVTGDFVFHCRSIWELGADGVRLHKPAIFSGSMFGALESIREGFGPLRLDAIGYCGKWGQSVPSSGGGPYFLVLDPHPSVRLGGR